MSDNRDFRVRCDMVFPPDKEGIARGLYKHIQGLLRETTNINPNTDYEELSYVSFSRCGHRLGLPCNTTETDVAPFEGEVDAIH